MYLIQWRMLVQCIGHYTEKIFNFNSYQVAFVAADIEELSHSFFQPREY